MTDKDIFWYYSTQDGRKGPFASEQIGTLIQAGVVHEHTKMWSETLTDWTPLFRTELRGLLGDRPISPPEETEVETPGDRDAPADSDLRSENIAAALRADMAAGKRNKPLGRRTDRLFDNRLLAQWTAGATQVYAIAETMRLLWIMFGFLPSRWAFDVELLQQFDRINAPNVLYGILTLVAAAFIVILFFIWIYRVTSNITYTYGHQSVTPAGSIYWWFVPVFFFWKPYESIRNIYRSYKIDNGETIMVIIFFIISWSSIFFELLAIFSTPDILLTTQDMQIYVYLSIFAESGSIVGIYLMAEIIRRIAAAELQQPA